MERLKWPAAAAGLAVLAGLLRRWQISAAFDEGGLVDGTHPATIAVIALLAGASALFLRMGLLTRDRVPMEPKGMSRWDLIFGAGDDIVYLGVMAAAAFCTAGAAPLWVSKGMELREIFRWYAQMGEVRWMSSGLFQFLLALCAAAGCAGLLMSARGAYRMCGNGRENVWLLLPMLTGCVWLLETYQSNAAHPGLWSYGPLLLAVVCGVLFYLECAGLSFEQGKARRMFWLAGMTVVLSAIALSDGPGWGPALLLLGQTLAALAALWEAPANLAHPPRAEWLGKRAGLLERRQALREREAWPEDYEEEEASEDAAIQEDEDHV